MFLDQLISGLDIRWMNPSESIDQLTKVRVCDLTEDSRTAVPGSMFIARSGTKLDGNRFIEPAIQCGCVTVLTDQLNLELPRTMRSSSRVELLFSSDIQSHAAIIAERFYDEPAKKLFTIGVTGTNGKSTIVDLTHQMIEQSGIRAGLIGTIEIDDGRERARASMTTPPALEMSRTLASMVEHECEAVVMEVSSHALDQERVGAIKFDACAFTNLSGDHLDYHQTIEHYQQSKSKLFTQLNPDGLSVICVDQHNPGPAQLMIESSTTGSRLIRCASNQSGHEDFDDQRAFSGVRILSESINGMEIELDTPLGIVHSKVPLFGRYNAMNVLQASLLAVELMNKIGLDEIQQRMNLEEVLPTLKLPPGRLERIDERADDIFVFVDFAHSDDSLAHVLDALLNVLDEESKLWCVFGCGGDRDPSKRSRMGRAASLRADHLVVTSDNPRTESPNKIISQILEGIDSKRQTQIHVPETSSAIPGSLHPDLESLGVMMVHSDRAIAIKQAVLHASPGDVILIAGKGHETEQIVPDAMGSTRSIHFDDREHARGALRQRRLTREDSGSTGRSRAERS